MHQEFIGTKFLDCQLVGQFNLLPCNFLLTIVFEFCAGPVVPRAPDVRGAPAATGAGHPAGSAAV
ncbi:hypothetical protein [Pseudacidovorax sp. RU35E]|jgi:hypothetical protein|uniref:hypothetical protein n=1 Tax=Pseudacidovorax sp. RU35E TaxID=1907403 RepID=UPI00117B7BD0|nr:hypothetical protein [Pseudacidovorax sp. RU35E]